MACPEINRRIRLDFAHGGNVYAVRRRCKKEILDFSANINPLGVHPKVKEAVEQNFAAILHYPDIEAHTLTGKIARYWGISQENILLGNGSVELIYLIMSCYRPKTTLIPAPAFSEYERAAQSVHSKIRFLKLKEKEGFKLNFAGCSQPDMLVLGNPNNPTGNLLWEDCPDVGTLAYKLAVIDEAFMDFVPQEEKLTRIRQAVTSRKIIVLRTFTKFFALAGLRIGYAVGHKEIIRKLRDRQLPWSVNALAQVAAQVPLEDRAYIERSRKFIAAERMFLSGQLSGIQGLKVYPSAANFLLLKIEQAGIDSASLAQRMLTRGILIRDCGNFRNLTAAFIRVAVRTRAENERLIIAFQEVLPDARN